MQANKNNSKKEGKLEVGDLVTIKRHDIITGLSEKLQYNREGPLRVTAVRGTNIELEFVENGDKRTRHLSEIAPFYERPHYLDINHLDLDSSKTSKRNYIETPSKKPLSLFGKALGTVHAEGILIVVSIDALSNEPNTKTLEELMHKYNFFNPYGTTKSNSKNNTYANLTTNAREPGDIQFWVSKTRKNQNISICSLVTHILDGPIVPQRNLGKYGTIPVDKLEMLEQDLSENRNKWLKQSLQALANILAENPEMQPKSGKVFIEGEIVLDKDKYNEEEKFPNCRKKMQSIDEFTWMLHTMGLETTMVYREKLGLINCTIIEDSKHLPFNDLEHTMWPFPEIMEV